MAGLMNFKISHNLLVTFIIIFQLITSSLNKVNFNSFIIVDSYGYTWISSEGGWHNFNGNHYVYYPLQDSTNGIEGTWIQSHLYPDNSNNLWSTTYEYLVSYKQGNGKILILSTES